MLGLLLSCSSDPARSLASVHVAWSDVVPTVAFLSADGAADARLYAVYEREGIDPQRTPESSDGAIALLGLAAGARYQVRLHAVWPDGSEAESGEVTLDVPGAPPELPWLEVSLSMPGSEMSSGYVVATVTSLIDDPNGASFVAIYNGEGEPVWWWVLPAGHLAVSPSLSAVPGTLVWDDYDWSVPGLPGDVVRARLDGSAVDTMPIALGHHVVRELEADTFAWMARDPRPWPEDDPLSFVTADAVMEGSLGDLEGAHPVVTFYDALYGGQYTPPCSHPLAPLPFPDYSPLFEWSHGNSLVWLPARDRLLVHLRWIDTLLLVDRASGEIKETLSGPYSPYTRTDGTPTWTSAEDTLLSHGHLSDAWDGGLVMFDNGNHHDPPVSSIVELVWDEESQTLGEVFRWSHPDQLEVNVLGDVRKLPGGTYLAAWSTEGELTEVSADGTLLWRGCLPDSRPIPVRIVWLPSLYTTAVERADTLRR